MKKLFYTLGFIAIASVAVAQETPEEPTSPETPEVPEAPEVEEGQDTTRIKIGGFQVILVEAEEEGEEPEVIIQDENGDEVTEPKEKRRNEAHWAGLDFGFNILMNNNFENKFEDAAYLKNDIARSQVWNLNFLEHKFKIVKEYVGLTTGLGFNWTQVALKNNYQLYQANDSTFAVMDTVNTFSKNKLRAAYITAPLMLEFNTNKNNDKGLYLAAGVVGGYRIGAKYKQRYEFDGGEFKRSIKDDYNLNPFKLDLMARIGYDTWGAFVSYSMLPLFESGATQEAFPLNAGISLNF